MELYGRPLVARRNTSPNVLYLNETKTRAATAAFAPPNSARNQELELVLQTTSNSNSYENQSTTAAATTISTPLFILHSKPPSSALPVERPQSSGMRRPAAGLGPPTAKQRPSTARESSRTARHPTLSLDQVERFEQQTIPVNDPQLQAPYYSLDEAYIRQLKVDIVYCHSLLDHERPHTQHVKNVLSMRESRVDAAAVYAQLARYNVSTDRAQLQSAKQKLEGMLSETLTQLMRQFLTLHDELLSGQKNDDEPPSSPVDCEPVGLVRPPCGASVAFANGCGLDAASMYTGCMLGVLRHAERFRARILSLRLEQTVLLQEAEDRDRLVAQLNEQLGLFKDALAKAVAKRSHDDTWSHSRRQGTRGRDSELELELELEVAKQLEHASARTAMEKERLQLEVRLATLRREHETLAEQLKAATAGAAKSAATMSEALAKAAHEAQAAAQAHNRREQELEQSLSAMTERYRRLDETAAHDKQIWSAAQQQLESRIREHDEQLRHQLSSQQSDAAAALKNATDGLKDQLRTVESQLLAATNDAHNLHVQRARECTVPTQLRFELRTAATTIDELTAKLQQSSTAQFTQAAALKKTELKLSQTQAEVDRLTAVLHHQTNQLSLLESKLARSVSVDEDDARRRQQDETTAWHQKLAALEHALALEKQTSQSLSEQFQTAITLEKEATAHTLARAKTIAMELETANLCLAERKQQRARELREADERHALLTERIAALTGELDATTQAAASQRRELQLRCAVEKEALEATVLEVETQLAAAMNREGSCKRDALANEQRSRDELASLRQRMERELSEAKAAVEKALATEQAGRQELDVATAERDVLRHKLQGEQRGPALCVELQRAKLKLAALEDKLTKSGRDSGSKAAVLLAARERKSLEDIKALKKLKKDLAADEKQLRGERDALDSERNEIVGERALLRQIITLLASRLALQMQLLEIVPPELDPAGNQQQQSQQRGSRPTGARALPDWIQQFKRDHSDQWRGMQTKWECLQHELDDADWQLVHMRNCLEELNLDPAATSSIAQAPPPRPKTPLTSPFSDAIAAGKDTVPVAQQLLVKPTTPAAETTVGLPDSSSAARIRDEEHETFTAALRKEMRAMKEGFERQLDALQVELRTAQQLRAVSSQRLRAELDGEKTRSHQIIAQWTDRCTALETQLQALQRAWNLAQDQQIDRILQIQNADSDAARSPLLRELYEAMEDANREEMAQRAQREQERVRKLLDYCGSSSVAVEREDKHSARLK